MPRSIQDILDHADELADRIEAGEFAITDQKLGEAAARVHRAVVASADATQELADAVVAARSAGVSWTAIGRLLGISGESARRQYAEFAVTERP